MEGWSSGPVEVNPDGISGVRKGVSSGGFWEIVINEKWICNMLRGAPTLPSEVLVDSIFYSYADEINKDQSFKRKTYNFVSTKNWKDVGLQVLVAAGWRPDCTIADRISCAKVIPPKCRPNAPIIIGNINEMRWGEDCDVSMEHTLQIEVRVFYTGGYGFTCSYLRSPSGEIRSQGWVVGWDNEQYPPVFMSEFAVLRGCMLARDFIQETETLVNPTIIMISAGRLLEQERILRWFNEGWMGLESAIAGDIIEIFVQLADVLKCPLVMSGTEWCRVEFGDIDRIQDPAGVIEGTRMRLLKGILRSSGPEFLSRIPRIPLSIKEVKARIQARYEADEKKTLSLLSNIGSISGRLVTEWGLTRDILREATKVLCYNRRMQVTLSSIITGTRFKFFGRGEEQITPTLCRKCGIEEDGIVHMLSCYEMDIIPSDEEGIVQYLAELAKRTVVYNPQMPLPILRSEEGEGGEAREVGSGEPWTTEEVIWGTSNEALWEERGDNRTSGTAAPEAVEERVEMSSDVVEDEHASDIEETSVSWESRGEGEIVMSD